MRRMRELPWHYYLLVLPILAIAFSIPYLVKNSYFSVGNQKVVANKYTDKTNGVPVSEAVSAESDSLFLENELFREKLSSVAYYRSDNRCASPEFPGSVAANIKVSKQQWASIMDQYHDAKAKLLSWLEQHKEAIPERTYAVMENEVKEVRIQRPPTKEEPDLTWRGIGIISRDSQNKPLIRLGGGFLRLAAKEPKWAKFELTRLVAQVWAPCHLADLEVAHPWDGMLNCLDVNEPGCPVGSYSESGWAVSSAVATKVANPGCTIPAFSSRAARACITNIKFPLTPFSTADLDPRKSWKEARR